jgi:6-phosphogluconolactonase (cycloisomerase 2 family)
MRKTLRLLLAVGFCLLALAGGRLTALSASATALAWLETQYSIPMLEGATDVAFSPDMKFVYVAAFGDSAASVFSRNLQTGALIFVEAQVDGVGSVQDLHGAQGIVVSPDGAHVYVASYADDAVTIFSRDAVTGGLTYLGRVKNGDPGISTLDGASSLALDAAGEQLYVASRMDDSLTVFDRDPVTGLLTLVDSEQDPGGALGLLGIEKVVLSPDGKNVYTASSTSDAVAAFSRDAATGALTWTAKMKDGVGGVDGLDGAFGLALDPAGAHLYATGTDESAIAIFTRDSSTGALTFTDVLKDGVAGVEWLAGARSLLVNPAGNRLYLVSRSDSALVVFSRDPASGALTYLSHLPATGAWQDPLKEPEALALSADATSLYVASNYSDSLVLFRCDPASGKPDYSQVRSNIFDMRGPGGSAVSPGGERLYVTGNDDDTLLVFNRLSSGALTFADSEYSRDGLDEPRDVVVSSTGEFVYVAAHGGDSILRFHWDTTNQWLEYQSTYTDGVGGVDGLDGPQALTISPDGLHLYVASEIEGAVTLFSRNTSTGALTWVAVYKDGVGGNEYLAGAYDVAVSPDGKHVYVASYLEDAITVFLRNAGTGELTRLYVIEDGGFNPPFLDGANALLVSPDNNFVYVVSRLDDTLSVFERNTTTGGLTWRSHYIDGIRDVDGLDGARGIAIDPAGGAVYVASQYDDALAYFLRDPGNGLLTFVRAYKDNTPGIDGLETADAVSVSPDGKTIYVSGYGENALAVFRWDYPLQLPVILRH